MATSFLRYKNFYVCMATHPMQPNFSGHARGRKVHLSSRKNRQSKTLCNMKFDHAIKKDSVTLKSQCSTCFNN